MAGCKRFQGSLPSPRNPRRKRNGPKDTAGPVASVFLGSLFRSGTTSWRGGGPHCRTSSRRLSFAAKGREKRNAKRARRSLRPSETTGRPSSLLSPRILRSSRRDTSGPLPSRSTSFRLNLAASTLAPLSSPRLTIFTGMIESRFRFEFGSTS